MLLYRCVIAQSSLACCHVSSRGLHVVKKLIGSLPYRLLSCFTLVDGVQPALPSMAVMAPREGLPLDLASVVNLLMFAGKAGGFLAVDWCDGSPVGNLARLSYKLHRELPSDLGDDIGYRPVCTIGGNVGKPGQRSLFSSVMSLQCCTCSSGKDSH